MKMFKRVFALALVLAMSLSLVACGGSDEESSEESKKPSIEGSWVYEEDGQKVTYTFKEDGTGIMSIAGITIDITYETNDDELTITTNIMNEESSEIYNYEVDGDTLTLELDGEKIELTKK